MAVADVFDVITSARSYKESGNAITAREEIARCAGDQFDPRVVRAFLSISLGRLRLAMGPLSWLAQAPVLGRIPLAPGVATVASSAVAVVGALAAGLVSGSHVPTQIATPASAAGTRRASHRPGWRQRAGVARRHGGAARALRDAGLVSTVAVDPAREHSPTPGPPRPAARRRGRSGPGPATRRRQRPARRSAPWSFPTRRSSMLPAEPVNHAPSFSAGGDQAVPEDSGAQSVAAWAHAISPGPGDDASQAVSFLTCRATIRRRSSQSGAARAAAASARHLLARRADAAGVATVRRAVDDGGTAHGGSDTSAAKTFQITVAPVNDVPAFTAGADQTVLENAAPQTVGGWATSISPGPANEAVQTVGFAVFGSYRRSFALWRPACGERQPAC